ncbi:hypothetical protein PAMC26577_16625 [Caballeronia sordidicola]|uniref:Uncharacterized protein n=1 Tax=Caballeronia sordidicola TaxID=196367 RepID=A0A242MTK0_CABSO|nr:hypothetical protein PAMC26577_16625 [Caballeronia sordidicola]
MWIKNGSIDLARFGATAIWQRFISCFTGKSARLDLPKKMHD